MPTSSLHFPHSGLRTQMAKLESTFPLDVLAIKYLKNKGLWGGCIRQIRIVCGLSILSFHRRAPNSSHYITHYLKGTCQKLQGLTQGFIGIGKILVLFLSEYST